MGTRADTRAAFALAATAALALSVVPARAAACSGGVADSPTLPRLERCELIAADGLQPAGLKTDSGLAAIDNVWGGHQLRIVTDARDVVHALYLRGIDGRLQWRLMRRAGLGAWREEAVGWTTDDVNLVRDARSDGVHVFSWVASVPSVSDSPAFAARPLPGEWQVMDMAARHYGAVGVGADGTACLKVSFERQTLPRTSDTDLRYLCGSYDAAAGSWTWRAQRTRAIGPRHAYDYLFPGAGGQDIVSVAQRDLQRIAAGVPHAAEAWVFNGVRLFAGNAASAGGWTQQDVADPVPAAETATQAPQTTQLDTLVDAKDRVFTAYRVIDPADAAARGLYLSVSDTAGRPLYRARLAELERYGHLRLLEDGANRLWLLWTNKGTLKTQVVLYPLAESQQSGKPRFSVGRATDLSASFAPYAIDGAPLIAAPRGGTPRRNVVDALMFACTLPYDGTPYGASRCYHADGQGMQRVIHFRIRLHD